MVDILYNDDLSDRDALGVWLEKRRLSMEACRAKAELFACAAERLGLMPQSDEGASPLAFFVPGRIEVLGKHTDYQGGSSIVAAVERGLCVVARPRRDQRVAICDVTQNVQADFDLSADLKPVHEDWTCYPMTVARRLARNFLPMERGANIVLASDLPLAAGLSSSSALVTAIFSVLAEVNRLKLRENWLENIKHATDLPSYLCSIENGKAFRTLSGDAGVGTMGGCEDHTAILLSRPNTLLQFSYCPLRLEFALRMPTGYCFVVGNSGVAARKTEDVRELYNRAARTAAAILGIWRIETGRIDAHLADAIASAPDAAARLRTMLSTRQQGDFPAEHLLKRFNHFLIEHEALIPAADAALTAGDLNAFGQVVDRSQEAAETLLCNQVRETCYLARSARALGAAAASAFGAGFGGSVWAMVESQSADAFLDAWAAGYRGQFPQHTAASSFFRTAAGPGMFRVC